MLVPKTIFETSIKTRGTTQIASAEHGYPSFHSTDVADTREVYWLIRSSLRLGSDIPMIRIMACTNRHFSTDATTAGPLRLRLSIHYKIIPLLGDIVKRYSLFLMIFPLMVLGNSLRNSTILGYL